MMLCVMSAWMFRKAHPPWNASVSRILSGVCCGNSSSACLTELFETCRAGNEAVCVLRLLGIVEELKDKQQVIQTSSVKTLAKRLKRFMKKHGDAINILLERTEFESAPKTTNALESKNSIFKPVSRIAKFFPSLLNCQRLFAGVTLMENFDEKTRGVNQGTNAMQRAGINLDELGGKDFSEVAGLPVPQISIPGITP
jgi:transposase-like protein